VEHVIVGIGVDVASLSRFEERLTRVPALRRRLFTPDEAGLPTRSLAVRFAAKEAVAKALGAPGDLAWHDCEVLREDSGAPRLHLRGSVLARARALGADTWHVSLSHDGDSAIAFVVAEATHASGEGKP
jgi:holo-[acyl-carrier protein] synthase